MTNTENSFAQGSIWLAKVYFRNEGRYKTRPVAIVGNESTLDIDVITAPVTSNMNSRNDFDIIIDKWEIAGLLSPSIVRTSKISVIPKHEFIKCIGKLQQDDYKRAIKSCKSIF